MKWAVVNMNNFTKDQTIMIYGDGNRVLYSERTPQSELITALSNALQSEKGVQKIYVKTHGIPLSPKSTQALFAYKQDNIAVEVIK